MPATRVSDQLNLYETATCSACGRFLCNPGIARVALKMTLVDLERGGGGAKQAWLNCWHRPHESNSSYWVGVDLSLMGNPTINTKRVFTDELDA